jgi:DNA-binding NtrC family response regulator
MTTEELPTLLLVDDDPLITDTLALVLKREFSITVANARGPAVALMRAREQPFDLALVDLGLPPVPHEPTEGYALIAAIIAHHPETKIVVLSGQSEDGAGRHARTLGATDFVPKPVSPNRLREILQETLKASRAEKKPRSETAKPKAAVDDPLQSMIGQSRAMQALRAQVALYAKSPFPVLLEGESGSGKEVTARALQALSDRADKPYFALNCAAIAPSLVEPTLFGYAKGAFTGAVTNKAGYFEDAADGTLFLDEIGELPLELQAKLLRVLENGEYNRVGETQSRKSAARVIAATNRDLRQEIRKSSFRADLYHRLSVFTVKVPPLREMEADRMLLLDHFTQLYAESAKAMPCTLSEDAVALWMAYGFPGNVRELRNIAIRLVAKFPGRRVGAKELEPELDWVNGEAISMPASTDGDTLASLAAEQLRQGQRGGAEFNLDITLAAWERAYVEAAMKIAGGNVSHAARLLGINRTTLYSRIAILEKKGP